jgi:hypothetical protein
MHEAYSRESSSVKDGAANRPKVIAVVSYSRGTNGCWICQKLLHDPPPCVLVEQRAHPSRSCLFGVCSEACGARAAKELAVRGATALLLDGRSSSALCAAFPIDQRIFLKIERGALDIPGRSVADVIGELVEKQWP